MSRIGIHSCGALAAGAFAVLAWLSRTAPQVDVAAVLSLIGVAWIALAVAFTVAKSINHQVLLHAVWIWAVAMRLFGLLGEPILEDDCFRYLWDGRQFALTGNPYADAPAKHFTNEAIPERFQTILNNINNPDVPTIYGPLCQYAFLLGYWLSPGALWPLKLLLIGADLVALGFLLRLASPRQALIYAWCPLLVQEVAFTAHPEILGVVFVVAALVTARRGKRALTAVLCAAAVAARVHAILVVPFIFCIAPAAAGSCTRDRLASMFRCLFDARRLTALVAALVCIYLPFWLQGSTADLAGLAAFVAEWEFNSSIFGLLKYASGPMVAKWVCAVLFAAIYLGLLIGYSSGRWRAADVVPGDLIFGAFLLLSAVVNPWYVLWLAPFVALRPSITGVTALCVVTLSYLHGANLGWPELGTYDHPQWLRPLEYGIVLAAALIQWRRNLIAAEGKTY